MIFGQFFRFIEGIEKRQLPVDGGGRYFGTPAELPLVHDPDLFCEKFELLFIVGQPGVCLFELFFHQRKLILHCIHEQDEGITI